MTSTERRYWDSIATGNVAAFKGMIEDHPDLANSSARTSPWKLEIDDTYPGETRAIHYCSLAGREPLLKVLLNHDVDLEEVTFEENKGITTALVLAAWEGSAESCRLLLEAGANPNVPASAETPLYTAAEHHAWDKVEILLAHGAKHDVFTACICGCTDIVKAEIKCYPPLLNRRSLKRNRTPLEEAIEHKQKGIAAWIKLEQADG